MFNPSSSDASSSTSQDREALLEALISLGARMNRLALGASSSDLRRLIEGVSAELDAHEHQITGTNRDMVSIANTGNQFSTAEENIPDGRETVVQKAVDMMPKESDLVIPKTGEKLSDINDVAEDTEIVILGENKVQRLSGHSTTAPTEEAVVAGILHEGSSKTTANVQEIEEEVEDHISSVPSSGRSSESVDQEDEGDEPDIPAIPSSTNQCDLPGMRQEPFERKSNSPNRGSSSSMNHPTPSDETIRGSIETAMQNGLLNERFEVDVCLPKNSELYYEPGFMMTPEPVKSTYPKKLAMQKREQNKALRSAKLAEREERTVKKIKQDIETRVKSYLEAHSVLRLNISRQMRNRAEPTLKAILMEQTNVVSENAAREYLQTRYEINKKADHLRLPLFFLVLSEFFKDPRYKLTIQQDTILIAKTTMSNAQSSLRFSAEGSASSSQPGSSHVAAITETLARMGVNTKNVYYDDSNTREAEIGPSTSSGDPRANKPFVLNITEKYCRRGEEEKVEIKSSVVRGTPTPSETGKPLPPFRITVPMPSDSKLFKDATFSYYKKPAKTPKKLPKKAAEKQRKRDKQHKTYLAAAGSDENMAIWKEETKEQILKYLTLQEEVRRVANIREILKLDFLVKAVLFGQTPPSPVESVRDFLRTRHTIHLKLRHYPLAVFYEVLLECIDESREFQAIICADAAYVISMDSSKDFFSDVLYYYHLIEKTSWISEEFIPEEVKEYLAELDPALTYTIDFAAGFVFQS